MSETIPEDVRNIANSIAWDLPSRVARLNREFASNVIARAILAERKRCAAELLPAVQEAYTAMRIASALPNVAAEYDFAPALASLLPLIRKSTP